MATMVSCLVHGIWFDSLSGYLKSEVELNLSVERYSGFLQYKPAQNRLVSKPSVGFLLTFSKYQDKRFILTVVLSNVSTKSVDLSLSLLSLSVSHLFPFFQSLYSFSLAYPNC